MDFIGIIRSLEELIYEIMSWLIFYPRTLWRILVDPVAVAAYSDAEQNDKPDEQYTDTLSPPLLLIITLLINYFVASSIGGDPLVATTKMGAQITKSPQNLLMLRAFIFAIFPLIISCFAMWRNHQTIDRATLRRPFFSQCFLITPFALMIQLSGILLRLPAAGAAAASAMAIVALLWFTWAQTGWFAARLPVSRRGAAGLAIVAIGLATLCGGGITALIATSL